MASPPPTVDSLQREVEALQTLLAERDDVLAIAAHELRNPLHGLTLQLALVRALAEGSQPGAALPHVMKAQSMLARYTDRVTLMLELVSLNAQTYALRPQRVDLCVPLATLAETVTAEGRSRGVALHVALPEHCRVHTDPVVVGQIVENLLLNAFKHAAGKNVWLRLTRLDDAVRIEVEDDGHGIDPTDQERIFGKFGTASRSARGSGSGLGLWIVRKLAASLAGEVTLDSAPGRGARFCLAFPVTTDPTESA